MITPEKCLKNIELVLRYVEDNEKKDRLTKEYEQKISEARAQYDQLSQSFSDAEIFDEFMRISDIMNVKLAEQYQAQFDKKCKEYRSDIASLADAVRELKAEIAKYEKEIPVLEKEWDKWDYVDKFCSKRLSVSNKERVRENVKTSINPFESEIQNRFGVGSLKRLKEEIEKVPDEWITIRVGGHIMSKENFLKGYNPTYCRSESEINAKLLYITVDVPSTMKGFFFKKTNPLLADSIPGTASLYNKLFVKWCAANWYLSLLKSEYPTLQKRIREYKSGLTNARLNLAEGEKVLKDMQNDFDHFRTLEYARKCIKEGYLKPLSTSELNQVKAQVIKVAASKLKIQPDDLGDYIALTDVHEHYGNFKTAFSRDRAQKYIDLCRKRRSRLEQLQNECKQKIEAIKIPDLDAAFRRWSQEAPLYAQMGFPEKMSEQEVEAVMRKIIDGSSSNHSLRIYPNGGCFHIPAGNGAKVRTNKGEYIWAPSFSMPCGSGKTAPNLLIVHDKATVAEGTTMLNRALINILLSLPPRKARLRIITLPQQTWLL